MNKFLSLVLLGLFQTLINGQEQDKGIIIRAQVIKPSDVSSSNYNIYLDFRSIRVLLNQGIYSSYPDENGIVTFNNIPPGKYIMEVTSKAYVYEKVLIQYISQTSSHQHINDHEDIQISKIHPFTYEREVDNAFRPHEIIPIRPLVKIAYFEKQEEFTISSILKSPYAAFGGITLLMVLCMKKMPKMEELQQQQQEQQQTQRKGVQK